MNPQEFLEKFSELVTCLHFGIIDVEHSGPRWFPNLPIHRLQTTYSIVPRDPVSSPLEHHLTQTGCYCSLNHRAHKSVPGGLCTFRASYLDRSELIFATLAEQLGPHVYAITFKLTRPRDGDRRFVSIIDCRGDKAWRKYFSKWHELAHLLTLTPQARLKFCRTHAEPEEKDPEEALMDVIAGEVGFCPQLVRPHATGKISFEKIAALRERLCPDASQQASLIGLVKAWPAPCVLVEARPGLKAQERRSLAQERFPFHVGPAEVLRVVNVTANSAAQRDDMTIHRNMRIPKQSVITRVFEDSLTSLEAEEDLAWWTLSRGGGLAPLPIAVKARRRWDAAEALIVPV